MIFRRFCCKRFGKGQRKRSLLVLLDKSFIIVYNIYNGTYIPCLTLIKCSIQVGDEYYGKDKTVS